MKTTKLKVVLWLYGRSVLVLKVCYTERCVAPPVCQSQSQRQSFNIISNRSPIADGIKLHSCVQGRVPGRHFLPSGQLVGDRWGPDSYCRGWWLVQQQPDARLPVVHQGNELSICCDHVITLCSEHHVRIRKFRFWSRIFSARAAVVYVGGRAVAQTDHVCVHVSFVHVTDPPQAADGRRTAAGTLWSHQLLWLVVTF